MVIKHWIQYLYRIKKEENIERVNCPFYEKKKKLIINEKQQNTKKHKTQISYLQGFYSNICQHINTWLWHSGLLSCTKIFTFSFIKGFKSYVNNHFITFLFSCSNFTVWKKKLLHKTISRRSNSCSTWIQIIKKEMN